MRRGWRIRQGGGSTQVVGGAAARPRGADDDRRWWWPSFVLVALVMLVWSIATPLMTGPDEASHVERAAAVARGQATGRREQGVAPYWLQIDVPTGLAAAPEAGNCFRGPFVAQLPGAASRQPTFPLAPSSCPRLARQGGRVVVRTVEYRGQPSYYVAVGWISLLAPDATGAYLMRALTALVCAAFVASALASTRRLAWPRLAALGVFAAMPPTAIYLAGMVNTNGLEIATATSLWATGLALVRAEDGPSPRLVRRAGLAFCTLVLLRGFSPFFALGAVAVLCWLAGAEPGRRAAIWQAARAWVVAAIVALAASCAWLLWITTSYPLLAPPGSGLAQSVRQTPVIVRQAVGLFGNSTSALPMWAIAAWVIAVGLLVGIALSRGRRRDAAVVGSLAVATFLFNIAADGLGFPPSGYVWQGRYGLPLLVGVVVLGTGMARPPAETDGRLARAIGARGPPVAAAVLCGIHALAFAVVVRQLAARPGSRSSFGASLSFRDAFLHPSWSPPGVPAWGYLGVYLLLVSALARSCLRADPVPTSAPPVLVTHGGP